VCTPNNAKKITVTEAAAVVNAREVKIRRSVQDRQRGRHHERRAESHHHPGRDQHAGAGRDRRGQAAQREHDQSPDQRAPAAAR
jgi:hypothetical protein